MDDVLNFIIILSCPMGALACVAIHTWAGKRDTE